MNKKLISNIERKRLAEIKGFLKSENIPLTSLVKIKGDASFRVYYRINNTDLILMDANPRTNEKVSSFIKIQKILSEYGINVPKIYKKDVSLGLMIIQDLGKKRFVDYINHETILNPMDILSQIHSKSIEMPSKIKNIKKYTLNEQMKETDLFFSWYLKKHLKKTISKKEKDSFKTIFKKIYKELNIKNYCLVLRDFHMDNIIPMPEMDSSNGRDVPISSMNELGLIDFQDALVGSPAYDCSSFIDDVRSPIIIEKDERTIFKGQHSVNLSLNIRLREKKIKGDKEPSIVWRRKKELERLYKEKIEDINVVLKLNNTAYQALKNFSRQVDYFSIQRNLKILGIFCRLKYRDKKSNYIKYLPRAKKFIRENLKNPEFEELRNWFIENKINV